VRTRWRAQREVEKVLGPVGVDEGTCRAVAKSLREVGEEIV
jgi:vacuolar iron transporter family protein